MQNSHVKALRRLAAGLAVSIAAIPTIAKASVFNGSGLSGGITQALGFATAAGLSNSDPRTVVTKIILRVITFMALAAVVGIVVAGVYLVLGFGNDNSRGTAKKIIIYTIIGLVILLLARVIVNFITQYIAGVI